MAEGDDCQKILRRIDASIEFHGDKGQCVKYRIDGPAYRRRKGFDREFFVRMGRIGGKIGGQLRARRMTPEQRSAAAKKAAITRWERVRRQNELPVPGSR